MKRWWGDGTGACRRRRSEIWKEVDRLLPAARSSRLSAHLESCPACRTHRERARLLDRALAAGGAQIPRQGFEERVLLGIAAGMQGLSEPSAATPRPRRDRAAEEAADWWILGGGLAAAAFVGIGAISLVPRLAMRATVAAASPAAGETGMAAALLRALRALGTPGEWLAQWSHSPQGLAIVLMAGVLILTLGWLHFTLSRSTS